MLPFLASAQNTALRFRHLSVADGLSQNNAVDIAQDELGFLWFATQDGLNRFDGYDFKVFLPDPGDPDSISNNFIMQLEVDRRGRLWIGSRGGVHRFDPETEHFENFSAGPNPDDLPDDIVTLLFIDAVDRLWVGTERGGLARYEPGAGFVTIPRPADAPPGSANISAMAEVDGGYHVGTQSGLLFLPADADQYDPSGRLDIDFPNPRITALLTDPDGGLWIGTESGLFHRDASGSVSVMRHSPEDDFSLSDDVINTLSRDRAGNLWVGTKRGLNLWRGGNRFDSHIHKAEDPYSPGGNDVRAIFEDLTGVLWIGLDGTGIDRLDPRGMGFSHLGIGRNHPGGIVFPHVWAILVDSRSELWVGSESGGLSHFRNEQGRFEHFLARPEDPDWLGSNHVNAILEDDRGMLWVGTDFAGLHRYDRESRRFTRYRHDPDDPDSLANDNIYGVLEDRRNHLWIATNDGVDRLDPRRRRFTHFRHDPANQASLSDSGARSLLEAADGSIWVGTRRGLNRIDPLSGRVERIARMVDKDEALSRDWILSIAQDRNGTLWFGSSRGLFRLSADLETLNLIDRRNGLPNDVIYGILVDDDNRLWLSTNRGIAMYDQRSGQVESFDVSHGLQANEFNQGASFKSPDGQLYFGGLNGITAFRPDEITTDPVPPRVVVTEFRLFNQPVAISDDGSTPLTRHISLTEELTLGHENSVFTLDFAALHYADPSRNRYAYRMLGLSDDWIETSAKRRSATFTALPAGDYRFQVRASNRAGVWSDPPTEIRIRVLPPVWRTGMAYAIYALASLLLIGGVTRVQYRRISERERNQRAIAKSEERLRLALWGSGDELWDWDVEAGVIHRMNRLDHDLESPAAEPLPDVETIGRRVHEMDFPILREALEDHLAGNTPHYQVTYRIRSDDSWIWVMERGQVVERDDNGKPLRVAGTSKDVSALKAAESALRELNERLEERVHARTEALQEANSELIETVRRLRETQAKLTEAEKMASLGNLVAGVAHEINTPVGVSVTAASHLVEQTRRFAERMTDDLPDPEDLANYQQATEAAGSLILQNLERAAQLISSFKQVAVDQSSERRRQFELAQYLQEILTSLRPRIERSGHEVELSCPPGIVMNTFPGALYQICSNLIINSITHAFEPNTQGTMMLMVKHIGEDAVRITYRDNGKGMSDEVRKHIFEPFFTTRRGSGGSGLGMHIAFNLVTQALQGTIQCSEAPGGGALFEMEIPLQIEPSLESRAATGQPRR